MVESRRIARSVRVDRRVARSAPTESVVVRAGALLGPDGAPGSLWVFPGGVPHCVLPFGAAAASGGEGGAVASEARGTSREAARVSVAINLTDERDAVPTPV